MEVVVTTGAIRYAKLQSYRHRQQTNTQLYTGRAKLRSNHRHHQTNTQFFLQDGCPRQTNSVKALKG